MSLRRPAVRPAACLAVLLSLVLMGCVACSASHTDAGATPAPGPAPLSNTSEPASAWSGVALGDSVTSGYACGCTPFPALYAKAASTRYGVPITMHDLGVAGLTSTQLLARLTTNGSVESRRVRSGDIDLITIGANDFGDAHDDVTAGACSGASDDDCTADELRQLGRNVRDIVTTIHRDRPGRPTAILVTGYWNVFEDGDVARTAFPAAGRAATRKLTASVNATIESAAKASGARYVDLAGPYSQADPEGDPTDLLAPDGDHPNAAGHALIARSLVSAGLPGLL